MIIISDGCVFKSWSSSPGFLFFFGPPAFLYLKKIHDLFFVVVVVVVVVVGGATYINSKSPFYSVLTLWFRQHMR